MLEVLRMAQLPEAKNATTLADIPDKTLLLAIESWETVSAVGGRAPRAEGGRLMHAPLLPAVIDNDERAGYPSASGIRPTAQMSRQPFDGQESQGARPGRARTQRRVRSRHQAASGQCRRPGHLVAKEREDWETCQRKRAAFLAQWTADCASPGRDGQGRAPLAAQRSATAFKR